MITNVYFQVDDSDPFFATMFANAEGKNVHLPQPTRAVAEHIAEEFDEWNSYPDICASGYACEVDKEEAILYNVNDAKTGKQIKEENVYSDEED